VDAPTGENIEKSTLLLFIQLTDAGKDGDYHIRSSIEALESGSLFGIKEFLRHDLLSGRQKAYCIAKLSR
jgi:hypothetical protein